MVETLVYLRKLTHSDQTAFFDYLIDWKDESEIIPASTKMEGLSFSTYLEKLEDLLGLDQAFPEETYVLTDEVGQIYGALNLRMKLDDDHMLYEGHIGYGIAPSQRGKGYGNLILDSGLALCREKGFKTVLITVNEENQRSEQIIKKHGGILENKVYKTDGFIHRYWIEL